MSGVEDKLRDLLAAMEKERTEKEKAEQKEASSKISEKDARAIVCFSFSHSPPSSSSSSPCLFFHTFYETNSA